MARKNQGVLVTGHDRLLAPRYQHEGQELALLKLETDMPGRKKAVKKPNWCWHCFHSLGRVVYRKPKRRERFHRVCYGMFYGVEMKVKGDLQ